jgi:hypothetical protein
VRILETQRFLDGVDVGRVQRALPRAVEAVGSGVEPLVDGRVRDLLDAHGELHARDSSEADSRSVPAAD